MKINIREDKVIIEGYVNAVERASKPLFSRFGEFIEKPQYTLRVKSSFFVDKRLFIIKK